MDSLGCCREVLPQKLQGLVHFQSLRQLLCSFCCYIIVAQTVKKNAVSFTQSKLSIYSSSLSVSVLSLKMVVVLF